MINSLLISLLCIPVSSGTDQTVLSAAERLSFQENYEQTMSIIDLHDWSDPCSQQQVGFLMGADAKPFCWMVVSPFPSGFTGMGSFAPPHSSIWFNDLAGISFITEFYGSDGIWHAVPAITGDFTYRVEINIL